MVFPIDCYTIIIVINVFFIECFDIILYFCLKCCPQADTILKSLLVFLKLFNINSEVSVFFFI